MPKKLEDKRDRRWEFRTNKKETQFIYEKMKLLGITSPGAYLRKMAIDGYIVKLDMSDVKEAIRLLRINSNNLNQYAKKANETGFVFKEDIEYLKKANDEMWQLMREILERLSSIT